MKKLISEEKLTINYKPGFGSWTYHLVIPGTSAIKGKWGYLKVIGKIDDHIILEHNLAPRKKEDKIISLNKEIRNAINKTKGQTVVVTLYLIDRFDSNEEIEEIISILKQKNKLLIN